MQFGLQVARSNLLLSKPCLKKSILTQKYGMNPAMKKTQKMTHEFPDILSSDSTASKESQHQFVQNLKLFLMKHKKVLFPCPMTSHNPGGTPEVNKILSTSSITKSCMSVCPLVYCQILRGNTKQSKNMQV